MRNIWTIAKREYNHYFISPIAYVVAFTILLVLGFIFWIVLSFAAQNSYGPAPDTTPLVMWFIYLLVFSAPALTMRLVAEEVRMGTMELMLTAPIRDYELIAGKWLGVFLFVLTIIAVTLIYPIILNNLVDPGIDQLQMLAAYLALILSAASLLAVGVGISAMFSNQIAAFMISLILFILLTFFISYPANFIPSAANFFNFISIQTHIESMVAGQIKLTDITYFFSLIAAGLFSGTMAIEIRRWR